MKSKDGSKKVKVAMKKEVPYIIVPDEAPRFIQRVGLETTILTGLNDEKMMMVLTDTLPGHTVPLHSHPHEQVGIVYDGKAKLRIGGEKRIVQKGDFYRIPGNVPHGDTCIGNGPFVMLDIFYPVREDFIEKLKLSSYIQSEKEE
jgi:quercetin dioxygenase-like cupin family protein